MRSRSSDSWAAHFSAPTGSCAAQPCDTRRMMSSRHMPAGRDSANRAAAGSLRTHSANKEKNRSRSLALISAKIRAEISFSVCVAVAIIASGCRADGAIVCPGSVATTIFPDAAVVGDRFATAGEWPCNSRNAPRQPTIQQLTNSVIIIGQLSVCIRHSQPTALAFV